MTKQNHDWKNLDPQIEECRFCYIKRSGSQYFDWELGEIETESGADPQCIRLPIMFEALERCSPSLREKFWLARDWVWWLYIYGESEIFFPYFYPGVAKTIPRVPGTNQLDLYRKMVKWVEDAFVAQYELERAEG